MILYLMSGVEIDHRAWTEPIMSKNVWYVCVKVKMVSQSQQNNTDQQQVWCT